MSEGQNRASAAGGSFLVALVGHGIGPSLSPALHTREAERLGLDYRYERVDLLDRPGADLGATLDGLERSGFAAVNITHPYKVRALEHVDRTTPTVAAVGSTNLVVLGDGGRVAHNTDYSGFRSALHGFLGRRHRGTVLQVGSGGAGRATVHALLRLGFERVIVHSLDQAEVVDVVRRFETGAEGRIQPLEAGLEPAMRRVDGLVHATPVGMREHPGVAVDVGLLRQDAWVAEVVYRPLETELLRRARARGLDTLDGGAMAVGQAADSLSIITGVVPDAARMRRHFDELTRRDDHH